MPIIVKEKVFGVIGVFWGDEDIDKDDISLMDAVVAQMSLALDRVELVLRRKRRNKVRI